MPENPATGLVMVRQRKRIESLKIDAKKITARIKEFYDRDNQDRLYEIEARLQRNAKYRMWTEGRNWPWANATDAAIPDMMTASMKLQDTLHNAVMSQRPPIMAKSLHKRNEDKEEKINSLIDYQVFVEQSGEQVIGNLIHDFVNEGVMTAYIPWVREKRTVREVKVYPSLPAESNPVAYFMPLLQGKFPQAQLEPTKEGWDWKIADGEKNYKAAFFTRDDGQVELEVEYEAIVFDAPKVIRKDIQDVLHPARCENLQIPGPSNPTGAPHVILRDFPTLDEIKRLRADSYYDLLSKADAEKLGLARMDTQYQQIEEQKDIMQGQVEGKPEPPKDAESHKQLTRLMCFDCFDINGDGLDEDVIFWMILEGEVLLRAKYLTQMFPSNPPRRPFAEAQLFPVPGRRYAIGLLEMMEGLHDLIKQFFDQGGDAGTIANAPFGFYRASSNMRPEILSLAPGELYPLTDPKNDVSFPTFGNQSQSFTFNMIALLTQVEERLTTIGDLQLGRVPQGKASALRTVVGMQTVLAQGDARPERVLRRFFLGLTQIWEQCHALNEVFLPKDKQYAITGYTDPKKDPYVKLEGPPSITGKFLFNFSANTLNTSKEALQAALQALMGVYVTQLAIQLGITKPDGAYRLLRDYGKAMGQDPDKYLDPPTPEAVLPGIIAEEAIAEIMGGKMPEGKPLEGTEKHFELLAEFSKSDEFTLLDAAHVSLFRAYFEQVAQNAAKERQNQALLAAAAQFQGAGQPAGLTGPPAGPQPADQAAQLGPGELLDESLPGAGGGANPMAMR